jgi:predicted AlkP superfamily phosphohydrolase/phosphomutase
VLELAKYDYDLLFVIISETDWLMHEEGREILSGNITSRASRLMKLIDSFIREIYETAEYLLIVSDHGFSLNSNAIDLKSILEKSNMKCRRLGEAGVAFKVIGNRTLHIPGCFIKILRHPKVRHYAKRLFKRINIGKKTTRAFHSLKYEDCEVLLPDPGYIYTAPTLKKKVINILKECSALNVYTPNELYYGPYIKRAPDLIVWPKLGYGLDSSITHSLKGITLIAGKDLDVDKHVMKLRTWDVAPLILSLLGLPIPHDTDGNVKSLCKRLGVQLHGKRDYVSYWKVIKKIKTASIGKRNIRHAL